MDRLSCKDSYSLFQENMEIIAIYDKNNEPRWRDKQVTEKKKLKQQITKIYWLVSKLLFHFNKKQSICQ